MLTLRTASEDDCQLLWIWANDPSVRAVSFSTELIPWEEHQQWFKRKLGNKDCWIFIALSPDGTPVGQIRFEATRGDQASVGVSVDPARRGAGLGANLIQLGVNEMFRRTNIMQVDALIKASNRSSQKAFERAGFHLLGEESINGQAAVHYIRNRLFDKDQEW